MTAHGDLDPDRIRSLHDEELARFRAELQARARVLAQGLHAAREKAAATREVAGRYQALREVFLARSCSLVHVHAHRDYWQRILPIPTAYARAPKTTPTAKVKMAARRSRRRSTSSTRRSKHSRLSPSTTRSSVAPMKV